MISEKPKEKIQRLKSIDFGPKNDYFPYFRHNFPEKLKTVTFNNFLMPVIRHEQFQNGQQGELFQVGSVGKIIIIILSLRVGTFIKIKMLIIELHMKLTTYVKCTTFFL